MAKRIILASNSARRKEILSKLGLPFKVQGSSYEEDMTLPMTPEKLAEYLSRGKAESVAKKNKNALIIAADTFIAYKGKVFGKPKSAAHAREMLTTLSGKTHTIVTGVTIIDTKARRSTSFHETTKVFMKKISPAAINAYIHTGEPMDKAGAYALQQLGAIFIKKTEGDFLNAVGLPLSRLAEELEKFGVRVW